MKIVRDVLGWRIEPSTDTEEAVLEFLLDALSANYAVPVVTVDEQTSSRSRPLVQVPNTVDREELRKK